MVYPPTDIINACIEIVSIFMMSLDVRRIYIDKQFSGKSIYSAIYGWCYGVWFAYFCGALNQPLSFMLGSIYVVVNLVWLSLVLYYKCRGRRVQHT